MVPPAEVVGTGVAETEVEDVKEAAGDTEMGGEGVGVHDTNEPEPLEEQQGQSIGGDVIPAGQ